MIWTVLVGRALTSKTVASVRGCLIAQSLKRRSTQHRFARLIRKVLKRCETLADGAFISANYEGIYQKTKQTVSLGERVNER